MKWYTELCCYYHTVGLYFLRHHENSVCRSP